MKKQSEVQLSSASASETRSLGVWQTKGRERTCVHESPGDTSQDSPEKGKWSLCSAGWGHVPYVKCITRPIGKTRAMAHVFKTRPGVRRQVETGRSLGP